MNLFTKAKEKHVTAEEIEAKINELERRLEAIAPVERAAYQRVVSLDNIRQTSDARLRGFEPSLLAEASRNLTAIQKQRGQTQGLLQRAKDALEDLHRAAMYRESAAVRMDQLASLEAQWAREREGVA